MRSQGILWAALLAAASGAALPLQSPAPAGPQAWLFIDFDAVLCASCLDRLLDFARALPDIIQEERLRGIVVYREPAEADQALRRGKIVARKWEAVRKTHGLKFPAVFHSGPPFREWMGAAGIKLVCLDQAGGRVRVYDLPLGPGQVDEVRAILLK